MKTAWQTPVDSVTTAVSIGAAIIAGAFTEINVVLITIWAISMVVDLLSGLWRVVVLEGWTAVSGVVFARGLAKKLAFCFFWFAGALIDALITTIPELGEPIGGLTPITKSVIVAMIVLEVASITKNARVATGADVPADILRDALNHLHARKRDAEFRADGRADEGRPS